MSDFSAGYFTVSKYKDQVYPYLLAGEKFVAYNPQWVGKFSPQDMDDEPHPQTILLSRAVPLLHVIHAEDHGFNLRVYHQGKVQFAFDIPHMAGEELLFELGQEKYGDEFFLDEGVMTALQAEVDGILAQQGVPHCFFEGITREGLECFKLFDLPDDTLDKMMEILTVARYTAGSHQLVYDLLDTIGLTEFDFISYDYIDAKAHEI